jgi:hypothetical protein
MVRIRVTSSLGEIPFWDLQASLLLVIQFDDLAWWRMRKMRKSFIFRTKCCSDIFVRWMPNDNAQNILWLFIYRTQISDDVLDGNTFFIVNLWVTKNLITISTHWFSRQIEWIEALKKDKFGSFQIAIQHLEQILFRVNQQHKLSKLFKNPQKSPKKVRKYRCDRISRHRTSWDCRQVIYYRYPISDIEYSKFSASII